jgi:hypothetical protein
MYIQCNEVWKNRHKTNFWFILFGGENPNWVASLIPFIISLANSVEFTQLLFLGRKQKLPSKTAVNLHTPFIWLLPKSLQVNRRVSQVQYPACYFDYIVACRPLLGNDRKISKTTTSVTHKHVFTATIGNSNKGTVFSVRSVPRCYKQDSWSNELLATKRKVSKLRQ